MPPRCQTLSSSFGRLARWLRRVGPPAASWRGNGLLVVSLFAGMFASSLLGTALAGPLADPTRPPSAAANPAAGGEPGPARSRDGRPAAPAARAAPVAAPLPVLQSVRVPASGAATAMIDGQSVKAGDTIEGRLVQSIDRLGITLAGRTGPERVLLLSGSPKQPPGSIATTHATRYEPAATEVSDKPGRDARPGLAMPSPTTPVPLSVAGRTTP